MRSTILVSLLCVLSSPAFANDLARPATPEKPHIDVVFCLDCSGSMGPVIETAKQKVWSIVNEIARAKPTPILRIGLLGYGNFDKQYRQFDLSDDLDIVYQNLSAMREEPWGDEWVGRAVMKATTEMHWSDGKDAMKVIYVVGNETARQGPPEWDYAKTAPAAIQHGIIVNAIYCGDVDPQTGPPSWQEMARLAEGQYIAIAQHGGGITIATPFDQQLGDLSTKLNTTYVRYGAHAIEGGANQTAADANSSKLGLSVAAERAYAKSSAQYRNSSWDLVDRFNEKDFDWKKLKDSELPAEMQKMSLEEREKYVQAKAKEREEIQKQIKELSGKRDAYVKQEIQKQGLDTNKSFDEAIRRTIDEQAEKKGFKIEKQ